jgi:pimeloyl-ACP methyl ester carboxylesterase
MKGKPGLAGAETQLFAHYGVDPGVRTLTLQAPPVTVGIREAGSGEPALLLHGITLGTVHWAPLMARLPSLRCVAVDMPGHGESSSVDYTGVDLRRWHTAMLEHCLDALGLRAAHLIGHSYGGMFALWLALDAPGRVRSVTSIGTPSVAFGARPDALFKMLAFPGIGRLILALPSPLPAYRRLLARSLGRAALESSPLTWSAPPTWARGVPAWPGRSPPTCASSPVARVPHRLVTSCKTPNWAASGCRSWLSGATATPGTSRSARRGARPS